MGSNGNGMSWLGNLFAGIMTATQTNEIFQIICLVLTCLSIAFSIAYNIYRWWKEAHSDGKISSQEIEQLMNIVKDGSDEMKDAVDNYTKKEEDK